MRHTLKILAAGLLAAIPAYAQMKDVPAPVQPPAGQKAAMTWTGTGELKDVSYIQRVNTKGGVAPTDPCTASTKGAKKTVPYSADYVFYKAG